MNDQQTINVLKGLVIDGVNQAKSGHPGGALSSMDFAYLLFTEYLRFDPEDPSWLGRDRFILSAGHESMLIYSLLNMTGWLELDELKRFRQLHSKTPGHPENYLTPGVECTTGPLGQGAAMSIGFAIANLHLGAKLDEKLFQNTTYALLGDGCMQEDITLGAASYAGHLQLNNLVWFYDRNRIQISGKTSRSTSDDERKIFEGFGWEVHEVDGHSHEALRKTMDHVVKSQRQKPVLIIGETIIAHGTKTMEGSHKTHGAPLPADERAATKEKLGLPETNFYRPDEAVQHFQRNFATKAAEAKQWRDYLDDKLQSDAQFKHSYQQYFHATDVDALPTIAWTPGEAVATRNCFGKVIEAWADDLPSLVGGSADLEPSNMTGPFAQKVGDFQADYRAGRNYSFGVREFPMSAICNGIALHGGLIPFDATFLTFSDYSRAALRLGAIQQVSVIHEFTHDSFYLGEDGPTHQAVEHAMSLRMIPDFHVMRPADAMETEIMMREAIRNRKNPVAICLSRQKLRTLNLTADQKLDAAKGGYILHDGDQAEYVIFATGSEVELAMETAALIGKDKVRVVSLPCWEIFATQDPRYQDQVLSRQLTKRISLEAGVTLGWQKFTGSDGLNIGVDHFGDSAPANDLAKEYGFTAPQVVERIEKHFI